MPGDTVQNEEASERTGTENDGLVTSQSDAHDGQLQWTDLDLSNFMEESPHVEHFGRDTSSLDFTEPQQAWDLPSTNFDPIDPVSFFADASFEYANDALLPTADVGGRLVSTGSPLDWRAQEQTRPFSDSSGLKVPGDTPETTAPSVGTSPVIEAVSSNQVPKSKTTRERPQEDVASLTDVTRQLTSRLGRLQIAEDGQARYYGATSNLHLLHSGPNSLVQPNIRHVVSHGDAAIAQAGLQWKNDAAYEDHLINLFFSWHNGLMYVLDKDVFLRERQRFHDGHSTDLCSPSLENAV